MTIQHECGSSIDKRANKTKINKYQLVEQKKLNGVFRKWPEFLSLSQSGGSSDAVKGVKIFWSHFWSFHRFIILLRLE
jgi:hypothetical protein